MAGSVVTVTNLDSVRIEVLGESRAVTIPASFILAADRVLRAVIDRDDLNIDPVENDETGECGFEATIGAVMGGDGRRTGYGVTPWGAVLDLADQLG